MTLLLEQLRYNQWAVRKTIAVVGRLDGEELTRNMNSSFSSIHETLGHMLWVEEMWFERWQGRPVGKQYDPAQNPPIEIMEKRFTDIHARQIRFLEDSPNSPEDRRISYVNFQGVRWEYDLRQLVQHLVFHSSYHRGQLSTMIRQLGKVPPKTDYLIYVDEQIEEQSKEPLT